jgi:putative DNA primase/helicase
MDFLRQLWPDDKEARLTLQMMFGLMLTPETKYQKIFLIVGPKRSGKGTIARVLRRLLGKNNVAGPTLASLSTHFGLAPLINKSCAIISDARLSTRADAHIVAERLLSISGEDSLTIDRKYRKPWDGQIGARFVILTNELPRISDASGALASRFVVVTLNQSFYGREDQELTGKLLLDLPGILNWSLRGSDRLREHGSFKMPKSSLEAIRTLEDLANPVSAFIRDWCVLGPTETCKVNVLFDAWVKWCDVEGHRPGSNIVFGRNLRAAQPQLRWKGRGEDRAYVGLDLSKYGSDRYEALKRLGANS